MVSIVTSPVLLAYILVVLTAEWWMTAAVYVFTQSLALSSRGEIPALAFVIGIGCLLAGFITMLRRALAVSKITKELRIAEESGDLERATELDKQVRSIEGRVIIEPFLWGSLAKWLAIPAAVAYTLCGQGIGPDYRLNSYRVHQLIHSIEREGVFTPFDDMK